MARTHKKFNRASLLLIIGIVFFSFYLISINFKTYKQGIFAQQTVFRFASIGDTHNETSKVTQTLTQVKTFNPDFIIHNGDFENDGVNSSEMNNMFNVVGDQISKMFIIRGNHDDHVSGSANLWENAMVAKYGATRTLPTGVSNYTALNSTSTYLSYSFDFGNSRFIGLDVPGDASLLTSSELTFLDSRLTDAENMGLTHAFIYWHGPEYCVENTHCGCSGVTGCGPSSQLLAIINKHPILSASFHGHEHVLGWIHMGPTRVPGITHEYEEFLTSSAGLPYSVTIYPARLDYNAYSSSIPSFATIDVNGTSFTVNFYHTNSSSPVWSKTFNKSGPTNPPGPTTTPTVTPLPTKTPTATPTKTPTVTPTGIKKTGDVNGDGIVNIIDIGIVVDNYAKSPIPNIKADVNGDGVVNIIDIGIIIDNYGR